MADGRSAASHDVVAAPIEEGDSMLILSRKPGEEIFVGSEIVVSVKHVKGTRVQIAIDAPAHVPILRGELNTDQLIAAANLSELNRRQVREIE
jgi:carbon storage regulator CsrA